MATPKTRPTDTTLDAFLATVPDDRRRADAASVAALMASVTGEPPVVWGNSLVGFGTSETPSGPWPAVSFAARASAVVLYLGDLDGARDLLATLGRHKVGKGCVYLSDVARVDQDALQALVARTYEAQRA